MRYTVHNKTKTNEDSAPTLPAREAYQVLLCTARACLAVAITRFTLIELYVVVNQSSQ